MKASHKESAISFLQLASSGEAREAFERYIRQDTITRIFPGMLSLLWPL